MLLLVDKRRAFNCIKPSIPLSQKGRDIIVRDVFYLAVIVTTLREVRESKEGGLLLRRLKEARVHGGELCVKLRNV